MGVDRPRGGAAVGGGRLSLLTRWYRLLGVHEEPVDIVSPVGPGETRARIVAAAVPAPRGKRGYRTRPWAGDGLRIGLEPVLFFLEDRPEAYVRVVADGTGSVVSGAVRAPWYARVVAAWLVLLVYVVVANAVGAVRAVAAGGGLGAWWRLAVAILLGYAYVGVIVANRTGKRRLHAWLADAVSAGVTRA